MDRSKSARSPGGASGDDYWLAICQADGTVQYVVRAQDYADPAQAEMLHSTILDLTGDIELADAAQEIALRQQGVAPAPPPKFAWTPDYGLDGRHISEKSG